MAPSPPFAPKLLTRFFPEDDFDCEMQEPNLHSPVYFKLALDFPAIKPQPPAEMSTPAAPPTPPPHLFRTIKRLQEGAFLCLPRNVTGATDSSLVRAIEDAGESKLEKECLDVLPHLRIVRTSASPVVLKRELDVLEALESELLMKAQVTGVLESSWLCLFPVFGHTLEEFGAKYKDKGGIPSWFLAHILLSLHEAVSHMHAGGFAHGILTADTVVLDPYPRNEAYRYRSYPAIHLTNLASATDLDDASEERDVIAVLELMQRCVVEWSTIAPATDDDTEDPMSLILHDFRSILAFSPLPPLDDLLARLTDVRHEGPTSYIPPTLRSLLHADLVTKDELVDATVVLRFAARHEEFVRIVAGEETVMGGAGFAGMRTKRIMVARFAKRKEDFAGFVGRMAGTNEGAVFRHDDAAGTAGVVHGLGEMMEVDAEGGLDDMDIDAEGESE
jgi:hypothetical protein